MSGRTLVTGSSGILGSALLRSDRFGAAVGLARTERVGMRVDLEDPGATRRALDDVAPLAVVHTVGLSDVDRCEGEPARTYATNVLTTLNVARWVRERSPGTLLVYISSDQVYSGSGPHREDVVRPVNVYGLTKHAGELAAALAPRHLVLRTNFYGRSHGARASFSDWILGCASSDASVVLDRGARFSALHLSQLVGLIGETVEQGLEGVFNAGARDGIEKVSFARSVVQFTNPVGGLVSPREPGDPQRAPRALDLRLDVSRLEAALGRQLPSVAEGLEQLAREILEQGIRAV